MNASASRWAIPAVGSSRSSRRGSDSTIEARSTTLLVPVESWLVRWFRKRSRPNDEMTRSTAARFTLSAFLAHGRLESRRHHVGAVPGVLADEQGVFDGQLRIEPAVLERADDPEMGALLRQVVDDVLVVERAPNPRVHLTSPTRRRAAWSFPIRSDRPARRANPARR